VTQLNKKVRLCARPDGVPEARHFDIVEEPISGPGDGQILVRNHYLSVEPAMRGWVNVVGNYSEPVQIGETMRSFASGEVIDSRHPDFKVGDLVTGMFGWQDYAVCDAGAVDRKIEERDLPLSLSLGLLGINGLTAYFALGDLGLPRSGDTVVVSTAAGAVGSAVGQLAKLSGCRTVGIAGGPIKTALCLSDFRYDVALDYKASEPLDEQLAAACPDGVDIYFDNTAGPISDAVIGHLAVGARLVICGTASVGIWAPPPMGPRVERALLTKRAQMKGFLVFDHRPRYAEAIAYLADLVRAGKLTAREDILDGIEACPDAIAGLYRGENLGKRLIRLI
jgi:NADPH-dependent curcumin reductase CurA